MKTTNKGKTSERDIGEEKNSDDKKKEYNHTALEFLDNLEKLDSEIEIEENLSSTALKRLEEGKINLAISQYKLENKKEELGRFKHKLALLTKQHASCRPND